MNRETRLEGSDTLIVVDRSKRRRNIIIAGIVGIIAIVAAFMLLGGGGDEAGGPAGGPGGAGAQTPTVTVVVPGRQSVSRTIAATGTFAARVDMPVGVAGEGGMVTRVLVEPGKWVGAGQPWPSSNGRCRPRKLPSWPQASRWRGPTRRWRRLSWIVPSR